MDPCRVAEYAENFVCTASDVNIGYIDVEISTDNDHFLNPLQTRRTLILKPLLTKRTLTSKSVLTQRTQKSLFIISNIDFKIIADISNNIVNDKTNTDVKSEYARRHSRVQSAFRFCNLMLSVTLIMFVGSASFLICKKKSVQAERWSQISN